jgi:hypothetical protein
MEENVDNTAPEEFDNIVASASGLAELDVTEAPPGGLWSAVGQVWPELMGGHVLSKGIIIVEYIGPEGRQLRWESSDGMAEWDILGQLRSCLLDVETQNLAMQLSFPMPDISEDDDDESDE